MVHTCQEPAHTGMSGGLPLKRAGLRGRQAQDGRDARLGAQRHGHQGARARRRQRRPVRKVGPLPRQQTVTWQPH